MCCGVMIFFCWPVQKSWRPYLEGSCMDARILDVVGRGASGKDPRWVCYSMHDETDLL
jgi:hypothetical protein